MQLVLPTMAGAGVF